MRVKWGGEGGYKQGYFERLPRVGWARVVCFSEMSGWYVCVRVPRLGLPLVRAPAKQNYSQNLEMTDRPGGVNSLCTGDRQLKLSEKIKKATATPNILPYYKTKLIF